MTISCIYSTLFRLCSEVRIINFLIGFSALLVTTVSRCFTGFKLNLSPQNPSEGCSIISVLQMGELTEIKVRKIHQIWMHILRHKIGFLEPFRSYKYILCSENGTFYFSLRCVFLVSSQVSSPASQVCQLKMSMAPLSAEEKFVFDTLCSITQEL